MVTALITNPQALAFGIGVIIGLLILITMGVWR